MYLYCPLEIRLTYYLKILIKNSPLSRSVSGTIFYAQTKFPLQKQNSFLHKPTHTPNFQKAQNPKIYHHYFVLIAIHFSS